MGGSLDARSLIPAWETVRQTSKHGMFYLVNGKMFPKRSPNVVLERFLPDRFENVYTWKRTEKGLNHGATCVYECLHLPSVRLLLVSQGVCRLCLISRIRKAETYLYQQKCLGKPVANRLEKLSGGQSWRKAP